MKNLTLGIILTITGQMSLAGELVRTDLNEVFSAGSRPQAGIQFQLKPGLYKAGEIGKSASHNVLIDNYVNDPNSFLVIMYPENLKYNKWGRGQFFQARPIKNGTSYMLAPLVLSQDGLLVVQSESSRDAEVIELSSRSGDWRYPYILDGKNGALPGKIWGMRGSSRSSPHLSAWPEGGIFRTETKNGDRASVLVQGDVIDINIDDFMDRSYRMLSLNGDEGKFAALTTTDFDTMSESQVDTLEIKGLVTFIKGFADRDVMLYSRPTHNPTVYDVYFVERGRRTIVDELAPGRRAPKYPRDER